MGPLAEPPPSESALAPTPLAPAAASDAPPVVDDDVARVRELLTSAPAAARGGLWLILGFVLFAWTTSGQGLEQAVIILAVLLVHELGHLAGMKVLGFTDLRMFFIPFFGAAAGGRKRGASAAEHAAVLLLGPGPGIFIGTAMLVAANIVPSPLLLAAGFTCININAFNLVPVSPLDGGQLFDRLLFHRHAALEIAFRWVTVAGLVALAFALQSWVMGVLAFFFLSTIGVHGRRARAAMELRRALGRVDADAARLTDAQATAIAGAARAAVPETNEKAKKAWFEQNVRELHDRLASASASAPTTIAFLGLWLFLWLVWGVGFVAWAMARTPAA